MTTITLTKRFLFGRFLKTLLIAVISTGLALPAPALALRPSGVEGTGLEELRQALNTQPTTPSRLPTAVRSAAGMEEPARTPQPQRAGSPTVPRVGFLIVSDDEAIKDQMRLAMRAWNDAQTPKLSEGRRHYTYDFASPQELPEPNIKDITSVYDVVIVGPTPGVDTAAVVRRLRDNYPKAQIAVIGFAEPAQQAAVSESADRLFKDGMIQGSLIMPSAPTENLDYTTDDGARMNMGPVGGLHGIVSKLVADLANVAKRRAAGLEEPTTPVTAPASDRLMPQSFVVPTPSVILQRAAGQETGKVGYVFQPTEAGLGVLFAGFRDERDDEPAAFYVLVTSNQQAAALIAQGVAAERLVPVVKTEEEKQAFNHVDEQILLLIPNENFLVGYDLPAATRMAEGWLRMIHGAKVIRRDAESSWATQVETLLAQLTQWLDGQGWVPAEPLTAGVAETIARINQMA